MLDQEGFEEAVRALHGAVDPGGVCAAPVHHDVDAVLVVQRLAEPGVRAYVRLGAWR
ncbi:hypothetical protein [Streptomyces sp. NRRL S-118]|uniref:hypothetical protein n=1 Tax=Streptomyces sp. NRRL S-118 TaxID=1463881 RepID=UPI000A5535E7|nr:hypothetical protein [Streptomyces sp. NRRL S-118]